MASSENVDSVGYIKHHLQNLQVCKTDDGWMWNNELANQGIAKLVKTRAFGPLT